MIFWIWKKLQLLLPYGLVLWMYKANKALPTNIYTCEGNKYKAVMITENYGILVSETKYIKDRAKKLKALQMEAAMRNELLMAEINQLSMEEQRRLYDDKE